MHTQSRPRDKRAGAQAHYIFIIFRQKPLIYNMRASARVSELCTRIRLIGPRIQIQFKWYFLLLTRARRSVLTQRCSSLTIEYQSNAHETLVEYIHRVFFCVLFVAVARPTMLITVDRDLQRFSATLRTEFVSSLDWAKKKTRSVWFSICNPSTYW